jgi:uncharacterized membrane protein YfcA
MRGVTRDWSVRAAWLVAATVLACGALGGAFDTRHISQRYLSFLVYVGAVMLLVAVAYAVHRALIREPPDTARRKAAIDGLIAGFLTGPVLLAVIVLAATIRDCSFGTGC